MSDPKSFSSEESTKFESVRVLESFVCFPVSPLPVLSCKTQNTPFVSLYILCLNLFWSYICPRLKEILSYVMRFLSLAFKGFCLRVRVVIYTCWRFVGFSHRVYGCWASVMSLFLCYPCTLIASEETNGDSSLRCSSVQNLKNKERGTPFVLELCIPFCFISVFMYSAYYATL